MVPTSYKVTPASPTIDRPGSIPISGASIPRTLIFGIYCVCNIFNTTFDRETFVTFNIFNTKATTKV